MIRKVTQDESNSILDVINDAAEAYRGVIPDDCWKNPYMSQAELQEEIDRGVEFYGYYKGTKLLAVMGIQLTKNVTLIRHAYVRTSNQRQGLEKNCLSTCSVSLERRRFWLALGKQLGGQFDFMRITASNRYRWRVEAS